MKKYNTFIYCMQICELRDMQIAANFRNFGKNRNYGNTIVKNRNF